MSSRPAPRVPASPSSLARLAENYQTQRKLWDAFEKTIEDNGRAGHSAAVAAASRADWASLMHNAALIMSQPPKSTADLLITLGMASSYIDVVVSRDDCPEVTILTGVQFALDAAYRLLIEQGWDQDMPAAIDPLLTEFAHNVGAKGRADRQEQAA